MISRIFTVVTICSLCAVFGVKLSLIKLEDIEYWDIDSWNDMSNEERASTKENIVNQLNTDLKLFSNENSGNPSSPAVALGVCTCHKVFGPVICDNKGMAHSNTCIFACNKVNDPELIPKKVFMAINHDLEPEKLCKLNL